MEDHTFTGENHEEFFVGTSMATIENSMGQPAMRDFTIGQEHRLRLIGRRDFRDVRRFRIGRGNLASVDTCGFAGPVLVHRLRETLVRASTILIARRCVFTIIMGTINDTNTSTIVQSHWLVFGRRIIGLLANHMRTGTIPSFGRFTDRSERGGGGEHRFRTASTRIESRSSFLRSDARALTHSTVNDREGSHHWSLRNPEQNRASPFFRDHWHRSSAHERGWMSNYYWFVDH